MTRISNKAKIEKLKSVASNEGLPKDLRDKAAAEITKLETPKPKGLKSLLKDEPKNTGVPTGEEMLRKLKINNEKLKKKTKMKKPISNKNLVDVIFLVHGKGEDKDVYAFFYNEKESGDGTALLYGSYSELGQHSGSSLEYAKESRLATPEEYSSLKKELESPPYGYDLVIAKSKDVLNKNKSISAMDKAKEKSKSRKKPAAKKATNRKFRIFIYTKEAKPRSSGGSNLTFNIWENIDNHPVSMGEAKANSASYKGDSSTVMNFLASEGKISSEHNGYYSHRDIEKQGFEIISL